MMWLLLQVSRAATKNGDITTIGRGGSDTSAAALVQP